MNDKKLISETLLDLAKTSTTEIIEIADDDLIKSASKLGIILPSPDLAAIRTIYAEIDKVNRNGVILPRKAVKEGLSTLIGKNINWEHDGAGRVCGYIIDAKINDDKIEIIGVVFKSLFPEEMDGVKEKFSNKKLAVSFEIWNRNPENGESVIHDLEDGTYTLDPIIFHGCGLLLENNPACPKAIVYKLVANQIFNAEENIVDKIFVENLIYASMAIEEPKCKNCTSCTCKEEENIVEELVKIDEEAKERLCPECNQPLKDEDKELCAECKTKKDELMKKSSEETQTEIKSEETKTEEKSEVAETKTEEIKVEETKEEDVEAKEEAQVITTTQEVTKVDEQNSNEEVITTEVKTETTVVNDSGTEVQKIVEEIKTVITYTFEQVQEEVRLAKEEKDKEISTLKEELEKIKTELGQKSQEIAKLTIVDESKVEKILTVGLVETEKISQIKKEANKINEIIASKHKK